jgi:phosphatidylinositol glycan class V
MLSLSILSILKPLPLTHPYLVIQIIFTILAITSMHVQIVTRVMTCFPSIYWYTATEISNGKGKWIQSYFVYYGLAQAVLYGAFLPPA